MTLWLMLMLMTTLLLLAVGVPHLTRGPTRNETTRSESPQVPTHGTETPNGMVAALGLVTTPRLAPVPVSGARSLATMARLGRDHRFTR